MTLVYIHIYIYIYIYIRLQASVQPGDHAIGFADGTLGDHLARGVDRARDQVGRGGRLSSRSGQPAGGDRLPPRQGPGRAGEERVGDAWYLRVPVRPSDRRRFPRRDAATIVGHLLVQKGEHHDGIEHRGRFLLYHLLSDRVVPHRRVRGKGEQGAVH